MAQTFDAKLLNIVDVYQLILLLRHSTVPAVFAVDIIFRQTINMQNNA